MYLITRWFGIFLCDKNGIRNKVLFPKDPEKIADLLMKMEAGKILTEEKLLSKDVEIITKEKNIAAFLSPFCKLEPIVRTIYFLKRRILFQKILVFLRNYFIMHQYYWLKKRLKKN